MGFLKRFLFASGPVMRVLTGVGAIALLIIGLKKKVVTNGDEVRVQDSESSEQAGKP
jgi:hypothetical protein